METGLRIIPFNHKMRDARKRLGMTQADVARLIGKSQAIVSSIERWHVSDIETMEDIACVLGLSVHDLIPEGLTRKQRQLIGSFEIVMEVESLDAIDAAEATYLLEERIGQSQAAEAIREQLDTLPSAQRKVIELRFGLGNKKHTLDEAAYVLGITRERVRQIEACALRKLRHPSRSQILREYL